MASLAKSPPILSLSRIHTSQRLLKSWSPWIVDYKIPTRIGVFSKKIPWINGPIQWTLNLKHSFSLWHIHPRLEPTAITHLERNMIFQPNLHDYVPAVNLQACIFMSIKTPRPCLEWRSWASSWPRIVRPGFNNENPRGSCGRSWLPRFSLRNSQPS